MTSPNIGPWWVPASRNGKANFITRSNAILLAFVAGLVGAIFGASSSGSLFGQSINLSRVTNSVERAPGSVADLAQRVIPSVVSIEAVSVPELIEKPRSNFSQEALIAAETRGLPTAAVVAVGPAINTSMIIDAEMNSEKQVAGRGLLRKISRTLLGEENEDSDGKKYVQFSVFQIPVKQ